MNGLSILPASLATETMETGTGVHENGLIRERLQDHMPKVSSVPDSFALFPLTVELRRLAAPPS